MHQRDIDPFSRLANVRSLAISPIVTPVANLTRFLREFLLPAAYDARRGTYIPFTHKISLFPGTVAYRSKRLAKKFHHVGAEILRAPLNPCLFANGLLIPEAFGTPFFDVRAARPPKTRATNIGFVVATIEIDCLTRTEFEELLAQIPFSEAGNGTFPVHILDRSLRKLPEYRGCCIVLSGRRSLHFHFIFSTQHLRAVPFDADVVARDSLERKQESRLMHEVHCAYWDHTAKAFSTILRPARHPDRAMRIITQYRRVPWGVRKLEEPSEILELVQGSRVVQLVLFESIHLGSSAATSDYLVPPDFCASH
jgi:hypothetical protein